MTQTIENKIRCADNNDKLHRTEMQKELVIQKLREQGCRITKQRQILLNVILQEECTSCKEIYYKAAERTCTMFHAIWIAGKMASA